MQLGASEEFPSCGLSSTVNTHDEEDATFPLAGAPASSAGSQNRVGPDWGPVGGQPRTGAALGSAEPLFPREAFSSRRCRHYRKEILTL